MNVAGNSQMNENSNVLSLFGDAKLPAETEAEALMPDPLKNLLLEAEAEAFMAVEDEEEIQLARTPRTLVKESQFPEQSMFVLDQQLEQLKSSLGRLKFYLSDLDDMLPR